jgi:hypothetical protein
MFRFVSRLVDLPVIGSSYVALSYFGYLTGIVGTAVWGYGDVLLRLISA